jgi:signal transduction histidine kinase
MLDDVADLYAAVSQGNVVAVEKRFEAGVAVCAVSAEIRQVFANVLRNAIEAVPRGGTVTLHVFSSREYKDGGRRGRARRNRR